MWIVAKYKQKEFSILKESFFKTIGEMPEFYTPKIRYKRYTKNKFKEYEKNILTNYIICRHDKFKNPKLLNVLKNSRGLIHFLDGFESNQKELGDFIKFCKSHEDANGFLQQTFFSVVKKTKARFISGPFAQMIFDITEDKGKKLKILLNNINMTISKSSSSLLYSYV
jgi:hypothetical protein